MTSTHTAAPGLTSEVAGALTGQLTGGGYRGGAAVAPPRCSLVLIITAAIVLAMRLGRSAAMGDRTSLAS